MWLMHVDPIESLVLTGAWTLLTLRYLRYYRVTL